MTEVQDLQLDLDILNTMFGNPDNYSSFHDEEEGVSLFPDRSQSFICTNWAGYVRRVLGVRVAIMGFYGDSNPASSIGADFGGHDFALVDGRWIVDAWAVDLSCHDRAVLDLEHPDHAEAIGKLYGDRSKWERNVEFEKGIDRETPDERETAMIGTNFSPDRTQALTP